MQRLSMWAVWIPILTGLTWLAAAAPDGGGIAFLFGALPGALLLSTGAAAWLWPGDPRPLQVGALVAVAATLAGFLALFWAGPGIGLLLIVLSVTSFVAHGALTLEQEVSPEDVPAPERSLLLAGVVAADQAFLGFVVPLALRRRRDEIVTEGQDALEFFRDNGWFDDPRAYHVDPPPLEKVRLSDRRTRGIHYEHLVFESGYQVHPGEPGGSRWQTYNACRSGHAWLMRQSSPAKPWLVCIHGLQMGSPWVDLRVFAARALHQGQGLNLLFPVLPLHGPRSHGRISGNGFVSEQILDTVHAFAQACWDIRRLLSWIRAQGGSQIGVYGLSLGGYTTALVASLVDDLACAMAGIPAVDLAELAWHHMPPNEVGRFERAGLHREALTSLLQPVAPLTLSPRLPRERRFIFGGTADRLVPASQVRALWHHWEEPRIEWYTGAHVSFLLHESVRVFITQALRDSGLTRPDPV